MYAWKCWRETRASFIFLLMLSTAPAVLVTLSLGFKEQNGWWHFDRSEYLQNPFMMAHLVSTMVLSVLWPTGFLPRCFSARLPREAILSPERLRICARGGGRGLR